MADGATFDLDADVVELTPYVPPLVTRLREMDYRADAWSIDELETLQRMFAADEAMADIAVAVAHSFHATRSKVCDLGLRRNSKRPWSDMEDAELLQRYGEVPTATLAQELGRSCPAIYARADKLGLMEERPPPYTAWEDAQIIAGYAAGVPVAQIAVLLGRTMFGVRSRAFDTLRINHKNQPTGWTQRECDRALELVQDGTLYRDVRARMLGEGFPPRSATAFKLMMQKLAYGRGWGRRWMEEEDDLLRRAYAAGASLTPLKERLGRGASSIRWRAKELGLQGTHVKTAGWRTEPSWTPAEDALLREHYGRMRGKDLAALVGRKVGGVYNRAFALGLKSDWCRDWSADEDRAIEIAWNRGVGLPDLALAFDRDMAVVGKRATALGFRLSDPARPVKPTRKPRSGRTPPTLAQILAMAEQA